MTEDLRYTAKATKSSLLSDRTELVEEAGKIGFVIIPYEQYGNYVDIFKDDLSPIMEELNKTCFWYKHIHSGGHESFGTIPAGELLDISAEMSIYQCFPASDYEQLVAYNFMHFCKILSGYFACSESRLLIRSHQGRYTTWFEGDGSQLIFKYQLAPPQDKEAHLFLEWLKDPEKKIVSTSKRTKWVPKQGFSIDSHNIAVSSISYDEKLKALVLHTPGQCRALISNSIINGKLISVTGEAEQSFHPVSQEDREEAMQLAMHLHSVGDIESRFGKPDFELPPVNWKPEPGELGEPILQQLVYENISPKFVYLFRRWKKGLITILLLGKEKA